jgi:hypothetical protein
VWTANNTTIFKRVFHDKIFNGSLITVRF